MTTSSHDDDRNWEADNSTMGNVTAATCGGRRLTRTPSDHFNRLLEEACPNHAYPVRHKLKDCRLMRSFMTSWSLTWGTDLDKGPDRSGTTRFPKENAVMMVFEGCPLFGGHCKSSLGPRISTHGGWGPGGSRA
jgi:hypothetical protein